MKDLAQRGFGFGLKRLKLMCHMFFETEKNRRDMVFKCFKPFTLKAAFSRSLTQRRTGFSKGPPGRQLSLEILDVLGEILPCRLHKLRTTHGQTV